MKQLVQSRSKPALDTIFQDLSSYKRKVVRLLGISVDVEPLIFLPGADVKVDFFGVVCVDASSDAMTLWNRSGLTKSEIVGVGDFGPRNSLCSQERSECRSIICDIGYAIYEVSSRHELCNIEPGWLHVSLPLILGSTSIVVSYEHESSVVGLVDITPLLFGVLKSVCGTERQIQHSFVISAVDGNIELLEFLERDDR